MTNTNNTFGFSQHIVFVQHTIRL